MQPGGWALVKETRPMVWSNWRGAVVMVFAWVGLAWSQAPAPTPVPRSGRAHHDLHENGKNVRCRVLVAWTMEDGAKAFQLQAIDSGEIITIVEDGPGITLQEPLLGGRVRSLPMRIFHWGSSRVVPPGVPAPHGGRLYSAGPKTEATEVKQVGLNNSEPIFSRPIGKDTIIRWEEKSVEPGDSLIGKSKVPLITSPNFTRVSGNDERVVTAAPKQPTAPKSPKSDFLPNIIPGSTAKPQASYVQVGATVLPNKTAPADPVQTAKAATLIPTASAPVRAEIVQASTSPTPIPAETKKAAAPETVQNFKPVIPVSSEPSLPIAVDFAKAPSPVRAIPIEVAKTETKDAVAAENVASPIPTAAPKTEATDIVQANGTEAPTTLPSAATQTNPLSGGEGPQPPVLVADAAPVSPPPPYAPAAPPALPAAESLPPTNQVQAPVFQSGLAPLGEPAAPPTPSVPTPSTPVAARNQAPTTAETASNARPADATNTNTAKNTKPSMLDKLQNWLHPKKDTVKPGDALAKQNNGANQAKATVNVAAAPKSATGALPFSTVADPNAVASTPATPSPAPNQNVAAANTTAAPTNTPAAPQVAPMSQESLPTGPTAPKKDWRLMWGQPHDAKTQVPGQSMVSQASAKPDPNTIPLLPPASAPDNKTADILLNPEKFDPAGSRLIPKGIQMNSYRGDPSVLMTKAPPANVAQTVAHSEAPASTLTDHAYPPTPPPPPASSGPVPPGAQSVVAAGANVPGTPMYAPPLNNSVPESYRPPTPPAAIPEPPPTAGYNNAFTPPPPPPSTQNQNPMTVNAFSNMVPPANMNPQGNPNQLVPPYPQGPTNAPNFTPTNYQPNPMAQGYPVAPGYPPNPNTMAVQGMPNPYYYGPQGGVPQQQPALSPQGYPVAQTNFPANYQGPQPPNPMYQQGQQQYPPMQYNPASAQYNPAPAQYNPASAPQAPVNAISLATERRMVPGANQDPEQFMKVLRESPYPAQREWASNTLSTFDWRAHPEIVQILLQVAQQDPAATVRASCVYSLGRMNAASEPVMSLLNTLRNDGDPRVRQEVEQALIRLGTTK